MDTASRWSAVVVGIAGVEGNGQFELVQLITGLTPDRKSVV